MAMAAGVGYKLSSSNTSSAANRGVFGNASFGGINFQPLDSIPESAFTGGGGTGSKMALIIGGAVVVVGLAGLVYVAGKKKG